MKLYCKSCVVLDIYRSIKTKKLEPTHTTELNYSVILIDVWTGKRRKLYIREKSEYEEASWNLQGTLELIMKTLGEECFSHIEDLDSCLNTISPAQYLTCATY